LASDLLARVASVRAAPVLVRIIRHPLGIPQYVIGHGARLAAISRRLDSHPGLFLSGNGYGGVSVNACIAEAARVAPAILGGATGALAGAAT
jgi:oxygen-dependent protoporphyrinogen oxidase